VQDGDAFGIGAGDTVHCGKLADAKSGAEDTQASGDSSIAVGGVGAVEFVDGIDVGKLIIKGICRLSASVQEVIHERNREESG
jgi:uncharacterized membrane protein (DUF441 family)